MRLGSSLKRQIKLIVRCVPTGAHVQKRLLIEGGDTPRITVTEFNNGISGYFDCPSENPDYRTYTNFISVSFLGTVFYQQGKASLDMKVHCLKLQEMELDKYLGLFLTTIVRRSISHSEYSDQISSTVLPNIQIKLPSDVAGEPDFEYMRQYMKRIEVHSKNTLSCFQKIVALS